MMVVHRDGPQHVTMYQFQILSLELSNFRPDSTTYVRSSFRQAQVGPSLQASKKEEHKGRHRRALQRRFRTGQEEKKKHVLP